MPRKRAVPLGALKRSCVCGQHFREMTEAQWRHVRQQHESLSERHKRYRTLKGEGALK